MLRLCAALLLLRTVDGDDEATHDLYQSHLEGKVKVTKSVLKQLQERAAAAPQDAKLKAALGLASFRIKGKEKEGVRHLRDALSLDSGFPGLHYQLARKLQERTPADRWARNEAFALYRTSLRMNPLDDDSYYQLGRLHEQLDGKDQMGKALKKFKEDEWAKSLGKEDDEAAASWREALKINPAHWGAHHAMSHRLSQSSVKKKRQKAREHARTAVELLPSHPASHHTLASVGLRVGARYAAGPLSVDNCSALSYEARDAAMASLKKSVALQLPKAALRDPLLDTRADAYYELGMPAWSKWPSWWRHSWPPRAPQAAFEGFRLPSARVRRGPAQHIPPRGRGLPARGRPRCANFTAFDHPGMLLLTGRYEQQRVYTDAHAHFKAALKLRPKDERVEIAMNNCAEHIRKLMSQPGSQAHVARGGSFGPGDDED